ncbi:MAG: hypothetical protein V1851_02540 [Patescibacteria group bacterium]
MNFQLKMKKKELRLAGYLMIISVLFFLFVQTILFYELQYERNLLKTASFEFKIII